MYWRAAGASKWGETTDVASEVGNMTLRSPFTSVNTNVENQGRTKKIRITNVKKNVTSCKKLHWRMTYKTHVLLYLKSAYRESFQMFSNTQGWTNQIWGVKGQGHGGFSEHVFGLLTMITREQLQCVKSSLGINNIVLKNIFTNLVFWCWWQRETSSK